MSRDAAHPTLNYLNEQFAEEDALLAAVRAQGEALYPGMQISPYEGKFLGLLVQMIGAKRVLEIGTFVGYSAICFARAMGENGQIISLERRAEHAEIARNFAHQAGVDDRLDIMEGFALESLHALNNTGDYDEAFDIVFIDAAKNEYMDYLSLAEPMLRKGGLMIGDNTLLFGAIVGAPDPEKQISAEAIAHITGFNDRLADPELYHAVMLPTAEGMTIGQKC